MTSPMLLSLLVVSLAGDWRVVQTPLYRAKGARMVELVREHFYDAEVGRRWAEKHTGYAQAIRDEKTFVEQTGRLLAELKTSHTKYYSPLDHETPMIASIFEAALGIEPVVHDSIGVDPVRMAGRWHARHVFADGPAHRAGVVRGDELVAVEGAPFDPATSFRGRSGRRLRLTLRRTADGPSRDVPVVPIRVRPREEWLAAQKAGSRILKHHGRAIAYIPMFCCAGSQYETHLREFLLESVGKAEAAVVDFRDGWGGCSATLVNVFNRQVPRMTMIARDGTRTEFVSAWRQPVVLLVNGGTRSGKELVASAFQRHRIGPIVGTRTAGAVVAGRVFRLQDGSLLYLAVSDVRVEGERLEGRGVDVDIPAAESIPYAGGIDAALERALGVAVEVAAGALEKTPSPPTPPRLR